MIVVTGATGQLGRLVVRHLLELVPADQIAVVVRDRAPAAHPAEHGVEVRVADVCSNAWNFFVGDSMRLLAEHGQGKPESNTGRAEPATRARAAADALDQQPGPDSA
jgi:nucleoside-diphosphate-sugar epimerase